MALGDMFLKIEGSRQGAVKGEARDDVHRDEIEVLAWSWGLEGNQVHGQNASKTTVRDLRIVKHVDKATTALMAALRNNEVIRRAVLTVRKAGEHPLEYFTITLEKGRITSLYAQSGANLPSGELTEELNLSFSRVCVQYKPQGADGLQRGSTVFEMDIYENR
jgi:type VI secretion system secreted protein Hcp